MSTNMNPTDKENWVSKPAGRNAHRKLVPLSGNSGAWSESLGPTHLAWMFSDHRPEAWPETSKPDLWFAYRTNPAISFWDTRAVAEMMARFPYTVCVAYTHDETNHMADILLPEATDIESTQLIRLGKTKFVEQFWHHHGFVLRQPTRTSLGGFYDSAYAQTPLPLELSPVYGEFSRLHVLSGSQILFCAGLVGLKSHSYEAETLVF